MQCDRLEAYPLDNQRSSIPFVQLNKQESNSKRIIHSTVSKFPHHRSHPFNLHTIILYPLSPHSPRHPTPKPSTKQRIQLR